MPLPKNWQTIAAYLMRHGYNPVAVAGILGNIEQESGGDPESVGSGGGGLIGFTPLPAGYVTGHPDKDLQTQLAAVISYNNAQGHLAIAQLNAARTPHQAALLYQNNFERPLKGPTENTANRTGSAQEVYRALVGEQGGGSSWLNLFSDLGVALSGGGALGNQIPNDAATAGANAGGVLNDITDISSALGDIPRLIKYAFAGGLVLVGVYFVGRRENVIPAPSKVAKGAVETAAVAAPK